MSAINVGFNLANTETVIIPLDRWNAGGPGNVSVQVDTGSALVEGTLSRVNRGETAVWDTLTSQGGTALTALLAFAGIRTGAIEAIRITATGATTGRVMQTGGNGS